MPEETAQQTFQSALRQHQAGKFPQAEALYRQVLVDQPNHADALHYLGLIVFQLGRPGEAMELLGRAVSINPNYPHALTNFGVILLAQGRISDAADIHRRALALDPNLAEAHCNLGIVLDEMGQLDDAIVALRNAISIKPNFPEAYSSLGNALKDKGLFAEAIVAHQWAISLRPNYAEAYTNLGNAMRGNGRLDEAIASHRQAITLNPGLAGAYLNLGNALKDKGQIDEALAAYAQAVALAPSLPEAHLNLGIALKDKGRLDDAVAAFHRAIALNPSRPKPYQELGHVLESQGKISEAIAALKAAQERAPASDFVAYDLAALGIGQTPPASPREYVVEFFNEYSARFDKHLVEVLNYRGPQLLFNAVAAAGTKQPLDVLDLGCGTGLCGAIFRPLARRLVGVDLAPRMIEKSRQRGVYDELLEKDLTSALRENPDSFDLILAADVFIYVGRLDEIIELAARALRPGGLLAFTIENTDTGDYALLRSRRYGQSVAYIHRLASACRFEEVSTRAAPLRKGDATSQDGRVIVLRRPGR